MYCKPRYGTKRCSEFIGEIGDELHWDTYCQNLMLMLRWAVADVVCIMYFKCIVQLAEQARACRGISFLEQRY